jgi:acyl CoA:acetate/3-ketoacid CoA transferase alpha subunit
LKKDQAHYPDKVTSKVVELKDAVSAYVKPGQKIFLGWNANAATCEIIRQYKGKKPGFTVIMTMPWDHSLNMVHCGLVEKLISSSCSYSAPAPGPSHVMQRALRSGSLQIVNWSLYSLQQRLMAGALGIGIHAATRSITGSRMATDNADDFTEISDPFDNSHKTGVVRALYADIAIIHALAVDHQGNAILSPVSQDTIWGAWSSTGGILITAEKDRYHRVYTQAC